MDFKNIAWDGISFDAPSNFEVSGIDKRFLQLDNGEQPCIELRWYDAGRTYKEKTYFRQLAKKIESASGLKIESTVLPASWKASLKKYDTTAFYWQSDLATGRGVMFYCKNSSKVMLIQFIGKCDEQIDNAAVTIFKSLKFSNPAADQLWCIYDMKATVPGTMALESFEFKPGRFNISLTDQTETIDLYRFSPADVILKDCTLGEFLENSLKKRSKLSDSPELNLNMRKDPPACMDRKKDPLQPNWYFQSSVPKAAHTDRLKYATLKKVTVFWL